MARNVLLNNIDHPDLKVVPGQGEEFGDSVNQTVVFPTEFEEVQREYPILFRGDANGKFQAVALLGLDKNENLFLSPDGWRARHVPVIHQRGPFMIGFQERKTDGNVRREPVIYVDLEDPRVGTAKGQPLFLAHGGNAPYLQHVSQVLRAIDVGLGLVDPMFEAFEEAELIEPASMDVALDQHTVYQVPDIYSINAERLATLDGPALEKLNRSGFLRHAYLVLASLPNVNRIIEMKASRRELARQA